jgi:anti-sigma B factor antagonist
MELTADHNATRLRVVAAGELDVSNAPEVRRYLHAELDAHPGLPLLIDLAAVDFIDSSTLGLLVGVHKRQMEAGQSLVLTGARERILRIFRLTGLDRLFILEPSLTS